MFKNEGEYADAMRNGRVFDNGGWICKFDQDVLKESRVYSPFVCRSVDGQEMLGEKWLAMDNTWRVRDDIFEIFENNPELEVDTRVLVSHKRNSPKKPRYFKEWDDKGNMRCYLEGTTSFSSSSTNDASLNQKLWQYHGF